MNSIMGRSLVVALVAAAASLSSALAEEQVFRGVLAEGDRVHKDREAFVDYYEVEVEASYLMTVTMTPEGEDSLDTFLYVTGPSGQQFSNDDDSEARGSRVTVVVPEGGAWEIEATGCSKGAKGPYKVTVNTQKLNRVLSERGELEEGDTTLLKQGEFFDTYELDCEAGKTYVAVASSSEFNTFLSVHYPGGLATNDYAPGAYNKSTLTFRPNKSGTFKVIMTSSSADEEGRYRLTVYEAEAE